MSTSSWSTVKRRASSFARSSTSPTSRESRSVSSATMSSETVARLLVLDEPLAQRRDMAADRGQRRAQLVRDRHEEVALELLRLAEPARHLAEAVGEQADLVAARNDGNRDVVVALRDLVGDARELEHRAGQAAREVRREDQRDDEPAEQREREPLEQRHDARRELVLRLRDDERADEDRVAALAEIQRPRDGEPRLVRPGRLEVELQRAPAARPRRSRSRSSAAGAGAGRRPGEQVDARIDRHEVDAVAGRGLELRRREPARSTRSPARRRGASVPCASRRRSARARPSVYDCEELEGDRRGDEPEEITPARKSAGSWKRSERNTPASRVRRSGPARARATPCSRRPRR